MLPTLQPLALNSLAQALSKPVKAFNIAPTRTEISFSNRTTSFFSGRPHALRVVEGIALRKTPAVAMLKEEIEDHSRILSDLCQHRTRSPLLKLKEVLSVKTPCDSEDIRLLGQAKMPAECSYPTMPGPLPYLKKEKKWGYEAWERMREVSDTTGNLKEWRQSS
ncbi:hypothetical protein JHK84_032695 [Glycine max]|nr:hypothetical protein JHK84_057354 [Glycine max]KAG5138927.1 hypothetical protein JHK84_032695 [Glycine max]